MGAMHWALRSLLTKQGFTEACLAALQQARDAPETLEDLASGARSEEEARDWAKELGLDGRVATGRFARAWRVADAEARFLPSTGTTELPLEEMIMGSASDTESEPTDSEASQGGEYTPPAPWSMSPRGDFASPGRDPWVSPAFADAPALPAANSLEESVAMMLRFESPFTVPLVPDHPPRPTRRELHGFLAACPLFTGLPPEVTRSLCARVFVQGSMTRGSRVLGPGQDAQEMYFVCSGEVEVSAADGTPRTKARRGAFFGEVGALFGGRRMGEEARVSETGRLAVLRQADLLEVAHEHGFHNQLYDRAQVLRGMRAWFAAQLPLLAQCAAEPGFLSSVAAALQVRVASAGETLAREGEDSNEMLIIYKGIVTVTSRQGLGAADQLGAPAHFGEQALLCREPWAVTARCATPCSFYVLRRNDLHRIMQEFPRVIGKMCRDAPQARALRERLVRKIPLFKAMAEDTEFVTSMAAAMESWSLSPGEHLFRQGDGSDGRLFAIAHGQAEVCKVRRPGELAQRAAVLGPGATFGELALLHDTPRLASVVALGHCHGYAISRSAFAVLDADHQDWWCGVLAESGEASGAASVGAASVGAPWGRVRHGRVAGDSLSSLLDSAEAPDVLVEPAVHESRLCVVCRTCEKCVLSVPCGHIAACERCHESLSACPLCRADIERGIRAFF